MAKTLTKITTKPAKEKPTKAKEKPVKSKVEAPAVKKSKILTPDTDPEAFNLDNVYGDIFDQVERQYNLGSTELSLPNKLSTGFLLLDTMTGGGISAGTMQILSGQEFTGKSTYFLEILGASLNYGVPFNMLNDIEGALNDAVYASTLVGQHGDAFLKGEFRGSHIIRKRIIEDYFNACQSVLMKVPDKVYRSKLKQWFYIFDADKVGRAMMAKFGFSSYNKSLYRDTGRLYCETEQKGLQGLLICDSFTTMSPKLIETKDASGRAGDARAFSENLKKVIGLLQDKSFSLLASQQTRTKPDATYSGIPELYESQGDAIKFLSSNRIRFLERSVPKAKAVGRDFERAMGENGFEESKVGGEKSYYGSQEDHYSYSLMKNLKNRFGIPRMEMMNRVLYKDGSGKAHGHCKVFDTWLYLYKTGRIERVNMKGKKQAFKINLDSTRGKVFDWFEFKGFITACVDPKMRKVITTSMGGDKIPDIRTELFKEIRTKKTYTLMSRKAKKEQEDEEDLEAA